VKERTKRVKERTKRVKERTNECDMDRDNMAEYGLVKVSIRPTVYGFFARSLVYRWSHDMIQEAMDLVHG
jgi:hypothetical protein